MNRTKPSILEVALEVKMFVDGSIGGVTDEQNEENVKFIEERLKDWEKPSSPFDEAVKEVLTIAVKYYRQDGVF